MAPITLTRQHKGAIRAIRKLKYLRSRRKFKEALKPYDVKDVIESYSAGHADLVSKVRTIQNRLDQILGRQGSKAKDVYESKQSLASRIVKTERQVDEIEEKLDRLITLYEDDRKHRASPHCPPCTPMRTSPSTSPPYPYVNHPNSGWVCGNNTGSGVRPRSILIDSNTTSEPQLQQPVCQNTSREALRTQSEDTKMSNIRGQRRAPMKKRVTLSSIPPPPASIQIQQAQTSWADSLGSMIIPPCVRIEGCTPPSDSSVDDHDADLDQCEIP